MAIDQGKRGSLHFDSVETGPIYSPRSMAGRPDPNDMWGGMSTGVTISAYLLSALIVWGGVGWLIDYLAGTGKVFTAIGMIVGAAAGTYLIYLRYGKEHDEKR
jgi:ATP synthase protein I